MCVNDAFYNSCQVFEIDEFAICTAGYAMLWVAMWNVKDLRSHI